MATGDPCPCGRGMLGSCLCTDPRPIVVTPEAVSHDEFLTERIATLITERDEAREECGHEKAMRRSVRNELSVWIKKYQELMAVHAGCSEVSSASVAGGANPESRENAPGLGAPATDDPGGIPVGEPKGERLRRPPASSVTEPSDGHDGYDLGLDADLMVHMVWDHGQDAEQLRGHDSIGLTGHHAGCHGNWANCGCTFPEADVGPSVEAIDMPGRKLTPEELAEARPPATPEERERFKRGMEQIRAVEGRASVSTSEDDAETVIKTCPVCGGRGPCVNCNSTGKIGVPASPDVTPAERRRSIEDIRRRFEKRRTSIGFAIQTDIEWLLAEVERSAGSAPADLAHKLYAALMLVTIDGMAPHQAQVENAISEYESTFPAAPQQRNSGGVVKLRRANCPECGKTLPVQPPSGGDGSADVFPRHLEDDAAGVRCGMSRGMVDKAMYVSAPSHEQEADRG